MSNQQIGLWPGWQVIKEIGSGSYGKVYEIQRRNGEFLERAALKVIRVPENGGELEQLRMDGLTEEGTGSYLWGQVEKIRGEIGLMQQFVGYSNIVSYEDYLIQKQENGVGWDILIRMELLTPLQEYLKDRALSEKEILQIGIDISQALIICHGAGIIHRDIKPQNIFINKLGFFKLGDFGISRSMPDNLSELSFKGTIAYMAPETYAMRGTDARSDIYSLALVLYRLLNGGREPFLASSTFTPEELEAARNRRLSGAPLPAPQRGGPEMARVLMTALAVDPAMRYQTAADFHDALKRVLEARATDDSERAGGSVGTGGPERAGGSVGTGGSERARGGVGTGGPERAGGGVGTGGSQRNRGAGALKNSGGSGEPGGGILAEKRQLPIIIAAACAGLTAVVLFFYAFAGGKKPSNGLGRQAGKDLQVAFHTHEWAEATCTEPKTCTICGKTEGTALGHDWEEATCEEPKTCSVCGETEGNALGHDWEEATCTGPKKCSTCGKTEGRALGHDWEEATCTEPMICSRCGKTKGTALGHDWEEATYEHPRTCSRCGETQGNVKGYIPYYVLYDGSWSDEAFDQHDYVIHPWLFANKIKKCRKLRLGYAVTKSKGDPLGVYECWARSDGKWKMIGTIDIKEEEKVFEATFEMDPPIDIDAVLFEPQERYRDGELQWKSQMEFYDAQGE